VDALVSGHQFRCGLSAAILAVGMERRTQLGWLALVVACIACSSDDEGAAGAGGMSAGAANASGVGGGGATSGGASGATMTGTTGGAMAASGSGGVSGDGSGGAGGAGGVGGASGGTGGGTPPSLDGCTVFPADNPWNTDVSDLPVHPDSDTFIDSIGRNSNVHPDFGTEWDGAPIGIPYVVVDSSQDDVAIIYTAYGDESDPGPFPVPADAPVEGGPNADGDRHVLVVDADTCTLYELYRAFPQSDGSWEADSGAVFDLSINDEHPFTWTSADAAGLPIFPGLARYDEIVEQGELRHALRFTVSSSRRAIIAPARHYASSNDDASLPPMGLRVRMKADYDCSGYSAEAQVVCDGLKRYGMIVADNGSDWYISGAPDPRWDDDALGDLKDIPGDAFEVVDTGPIETY
jgi:hypothetical protein